MAVHKVAFKTKTNKNVTFYASKHKAKTLAKLSSGKMVIVNDSEVGDAIIVSFNKHNKSLQLRRKVTHHKNGKKGSRYEFIDKQTALNSPGVPFLFLALDGEHGKVREFLLKKTRLI